MAVELHLVVDRRACRHGVQIGGACDRIGRNRFLGLGGGLFGSDQGLELCTRAAIVRWAENQPDMLTLSESIRRLVELGLKAKAK